jgi:hypothetical protein
MKYFKHVFISLLIIIFLIILFIYTSQQNIIEGATTTASSRLVISSESYTPVTSCLIPDTNTYSIQSSNFYFYKNNNTSANPKFRPFFFLQNNYDSNIITNIFNDNRQYNIDCSYVLYFINSNSKNYWYQNNNSNRIKCYLMNSGTFIACLKYFNDSFTSTITNGIPKPDLTNVTIKYNSISTTNKNNSRGELTIKFINDSSVTTNNPKYNFELTINVNKTSTNLNQFETILIDYLINNNIINTSFDKTTIKYIDLTYNTSSDSYNINLYNSQGSILISYNNFKINDLFTIVFGLFSDSANSIVNEIKSIYNVQESGIPLYLNTATNNNRFSCGYIQDSNQNKSYPFIP